jgi:hypothetical protein
MTEIIYTITLWLALVMPTGEVVIVGKTADSPMACVREMKYRQINFDGYGYTAELWCEIYKEGGA